MDQARDHIIQEIVEDMALMGRRIASQRKIPPADRKISRGQVIVLTIVGNRDGLSIKDIAESMHISGSAATQLVDSLVRAGLLAREVDPNDRRIMRISLTDEGKSRLEKFRKARLEAMGEILSPLSRQELETFRNLLRKIIASNPKLSELRSEND
jgi:DNA-binding MarR family transcriptional regulator